MIPRLEGAEPLAPAWAEAIASQLSAAAPGRDVRAMAVAAAAECDATCLGARIADAGASLGVLLDVRVQVARNVRSVAVTLSAVAPVSGETLVEPMAVAFTDGAPVVALDAIVARMPAPPPPPARLVVAVDVDGATVEVDGAAIGQSPLAPVELAPGPHEVTVRARGHEDFARRVEVTAEGARVDVRLTPAADEAARLAAADQGTTFDTVETDDPLWKKWWLWAAVGGAVVVGLVVGIAVAASGGEGGGGGFPVPPIPGVMP
ncbi:MAG: PEGA domain-containing protein [Sandaracinus sp.]|nr:PEGA domain-containing protein [Sandaracinus sp.]